jgi:hypothetical protein
MSLGRPDAAVTLDGNRLTAAEAALGALQVELAVGSAHDRFRASLAALSNFAGVDAGATAVVELGYGDDLGTVLTGTVTSVERRQWGLVVEGLAATVSLSRTYLGRSYVSQSAGDIVTDLVGGANADVGEVSAPLQLSAFHVDERRSVWSHVCALAQLAGCELSADGEGALNFRPPKSGTPDHSFRHGAEVVAWDVGPRDTTRTDVSVVPFGAASEQGSDHWHVLLREPDGGPPSDETLVAAALRDRDGAQTFEQAIRDARTRRGTGGEVLVGGDATVRAGDVVTLDDLPNGDGSPLRVTAATHRIGGGSGFHTHLRVEGVAP